MQKIILTGEIWKERNMYTAYCRELDVATCGKTVEEAWSNLKETLEIFFEETSRKGTLIELLEEAGFIMDEDVLKRKDYLLGQIEFSFPVGK
ncbi:MAG: type II toxin-antitoxin system HicB family antitoxin [Thermodesulfobacteriota bacterium]